MIAVDCRAGLLWWATTVPLCDLPAAVLYVHTISPYFITWLVFVSCLTISNCFSSVSVSRFVWWPKCNHWIIEVHIGKGQSFNFKLLPVTNHVRVLHPLHTVQISQVSPKKFVMVACIGGFMGICCSCGKNCKINCSKSCLHSTHKLQ